MRQCRMMMVRTLKQYKFLYEVLFDTMVAGFSSLMEANDVRTTYDALRIKDASSNKSGFYKDFEILEAYTERASLLECSEASKEENASKNRFNSLNLLPKDVHLVRIHETVAVASTQQYINAIYVNSTSQQNRFIATQTPLINTATEFWQMIVQHKVGCIVSMRSSNFVEETCCDYLPSLREGVKILDGKFVIKSLEFERSDHFSRHKLSLTSKEAKGDFRRTIDHYRFESWRMYEQVPWSKEGLLGLVDKMLTREGPIVVHCVDGASQSGLFIGAYNVCERMKLHGHTDIFHEVKALKERRFHFINDLVGFLLFDLVLVDLICISLKINLQFKSYKYLIFIQCK